MNMDFVSATENVIDLERGPKPGEPPNTSISQALSQASTLTSKPSSPGWKSLQWLPSWSIKNDDGRKPKIRIRKSLVPRPNSRQWLTELLLAVEDKHRGYRSLSTFLNSDENFMLYRRFGYLHSRMLLRKQDELRKLESDLDAWDEADVEEGTEHARMLLMSRDSDEAEDKNASPGTRTRTQILDEIEKKLEKYDDWVLKARQMVAMNKPAARDHRSVESYMFDKKPLVDEEREFIYMKDDLITLRDGREMALLDCFTEYMLQVFHCPWLQYLFCTKEDREKTSDPSLHYYSKSRKECLITTILTLVLLSLLIVPVFLLYRLTTYHDLDITYTVSIVIILLFTLAFSAVLSLFTKARRHEIFGAAAGYCAVLVVFISNIPGVNS